MTIVGTADAIPFLSHSLSCVQILKIYNQGIPVWGQRQRTVQLCVISIEYLFILFKDFEILSLYIPKYMYLMAFYLFAFAFIFFPIHICVIFGIQIILCFLVNKGFVRLRKPFCLHICVTLRVSSIDVSQISYTTSRKTVRPQSPSPTYAVEYSVSCQAPLDRGTPDHHK